MESKTPEGFADVHPAVAADRVQTWYGHLAGRTIREVRPLTEEELASFGWDRKFQEIPMAMVLDNGTTVYLVQDFECNGPGALIFDR